MPTAQGTLNLIITSLTHTRMGFSLKEIMMGIRKCGYKVLASFPVAQSWPKLKKKEENEKEREIVQVATRRAKVAVMSALRKTNGG